MDKQFQVDREILMYAMRYALGRMTFAPMTVVENIKHNIDLFSEGDLEIFIRDIEEQESYGRQALGMNCDIETWLNFKQYLKDRTQKEL